MGKVYYIEGGLIATTGNLYTKDVYSGVTDCPNDAIIITPNNAILEITKDEGSIFDIYYVKSGVVSSGNGDIYSFKDIYQFTIDSYNRDKQSLLRLLSDPPADLQLRRIFYQQQYAYVFSLMERFMSDTFVRQTCDNEESYHRVLDSGILLSMNNIVRNKVNKNIITGKDCLSKELLYISTIQKCIVYHRLSLVHDLFSIAFNIEADFDELKDSLEIRHDIIHRFGRSIKGVERSISEADIQNLIDKVDRCVNSISSQMSK